MGEFELIRRYFAAAPCARGGPGVALGIGDDCALLAPAPGEQLAVSTDTLTAGVHFPDPCPDAHGLGQRALAVSASDLAAMGATPLGFTLALTLPSIEPAWLEGLAAGLVQMAEQCELRLVGGDTTRGPLSLTLTVFGQVPAGQALLRSGARPGDLLCLGGAPGEAGGALPFVLGQRAAEGAASRHLLARYWAPQPQFELGLWLRGRATAAQDVSDGLVADCGHIAAASGVRLVVEAARLPVSPALAELFPADEVLRLALGAGDDYLLVFTLPPDQAPALAAAWPQAQVIGRVEAGSGVVVLAADGQPMIPAQAGFQHF